MKGYVKVKLLKIVEGESKKGKKWVYLMVQDEDFQNYNLFLENVKDKETFEKQEDQEMEIPITIIKQFNKNNNTFETIVRVTDNEKL